MRPHKLLRGLTAEQTVSAAGSRPWGLQRLLAWAERRAWALTLLLLLAHALVFSAATIYKLHSFWMGFDLGTHEQVLWNTIHGRIAETSAFGHTRSYLGIDIIVLELLFAPFYWLLPKAETMLVLQILVASSGAIPIYLLGKQRGGRGLDGLLGALLYLASLPVQYAMLYEFQIRTAGTVLFLWAMLYFARERLRPFLICGVLALWTRSDAGFALAAIGFAALVLRRPWPWVIAPAALGLGWVVLCMKVLIPAFRDDQGFLYGFLYAWLGDSIPDMAVTLLTRPGYVAEHVLTGEKLRYLLELLGPLLFLPLLRPRLALIALPSLLLNLLSPDRIHWNIRYHYQAFVIPFLLVAALYALIDLRQRRPALSQALTAVLLLVTLGQQLVLRSPLVGLATRPRDAERIALANQLLAMIPPDVPVTASNTLGSHLARRRERYIFPGVNSLTTGDPVYPAELAERGRYLLADLREVPAADQQTLREFQRDGRWRTLFDEREFLLLERLL